MTQPPWSPTLPNFDRSVLNQTFDVNKDWSVEIWHRRPTSTTFFEGSLADFQKINFNNNWEGGFPDLCGIDSQRPPAQVALTTDLDTDSVFIVFKARINIFVFLSDWNMIFCQNSCHIIYPVTIVRNDVWRWKFNKCFVANSHFSDGSAAARRGLASSS